MAVSTDYLIKTAETISLMIKTQYVQAHRQGGAQSAQAPPRSLQGPPDGIVFNI